MSSQRVFIGFITYGNTTAKYLPYFLPSLKAQDFSDYQIIAVDNSEMQENENAVFIRNNFPEINFKWSGKNLGFAKAFNIMIRQAIEEGAEYFLAVNPDTIMESDALRRMVEQIEHDEKIGAIAPKILRWDFINQAKTSYIDSNGLYITKEHRFSDRHQGQDDLNQTQPEEVFGFTGAAVLFRLDALQDVAYSEGERKEYFDELMFMYKEDCDLSYRLRLAGWKVVFAPQSVFFHDRTASPKGESNLKIMLNRLNKNRQLKKWSYLNHWILLFKLCGLPFSWPVKLATACYQLKSLIFILFFEQYLISEFAQAIKLNPEIKKRRLQLKIRVDMKMIERLME